MERKNYIFIYIFTIFALVLSSDYSCVQKSPCLCEFSDDKNIDLTNLVPNNNFISASKGNYTYYFNGCINSKIEDKININNISYDSCTNPLTLCFFNATNRALYVAGDAAATVFTLDKTNPQVHEFVYSFHTNKSVTINTTIVLDCVPESTENYFVFQNVTNNEHRLHLFSPLACKLEAHHGMGFFSKFLVILLVFATIYLIGGSLVRYFLVGARGKEVIPNLEFWTSVPDHIKNGIYFITHGCNRRMASSGETYDQI